MASISAGKFRSGAILPTSLSTAPVWLSNWTENSTGSRNSKSMIEFAIKPYRVTGISFFASPTLKCLETWTAS